MSNGKVETLSWDWKESVDVDELARKLKPYGVYVYDDPRMEGSDCYGIILSPKEMTAEELANFDEDDY